MPVNIPNSSVCRRCASSSVYPRILSVPYRSNLYYDTKIQIGIWIETFSQDWGLQLLAVPAFSPLGGQSHLDFRIFCFSRCVWHSSHRSSLKSVARFQCSKPKAVKGLGDTLEKITPADLQRVLHGPQPPLGWADQHTDSRNMLP